MYARDQTSLSMPEDARAGISHHEPEGHEEFRVFPMPTVCSRSRSIHMDTQQSAEPLAVTWVFSRQRYVRWVSFWVFDSVEIGSGNVYDTDLGPHL